MVTSPLLTKHALHRAWTAHRSPCGSGMDSCMGSVDATTNGRSARPSPARAGRFMGARRGRAPAELKILGISLFWLLTLTFVVIIPHHSLVFVLARMGPYPTFLSSLSLCNPFRARPWVAILSLGGFVVDYQRSIVPTARFF